MDDPEGSGASGAPPPPPASGPSRSIKVVIRGPIAPCDVPGLWDRVRLPLDGRDGGVVLCDVAALVHPDAVTVDALARLQLAARRVGRQVRLLHACGELRHLLALMGLATVVPPAQ